MSNEKQRDARPREVLEPRLSKMADGEWLSDIAHRGTGVLQFRKQRGVVRAYVRYTRPDGTRDRIPLGPWDPKGKAGRTLAQLKVDFRKWSARYQAGEHNLRAAQEERDRAAEQARREAEEAAREKSSQTLGALCEAYADQLRHDRKVSHAEVRKRLQRHVRDKHPKLWATPAVDAMPEQVIEVMRALVDRGKARTANLIRSYLRSAYRTAINARLSPKSRPALLAFNIKSNPVRDIAMAEDTGGVRDRVLSVAELRAYWTALKEFAGPAGAALRFHLMTGGQRFAQLRRAMTKDIDHDAHAIRLLDGKGRRRKPRTHWVPLVEPAEDAMAAMCPVRLGPYLFTLTRGQTPADRAALSRALKQIAGGLVADGRASALFSLGDVRRTVETVLSGAGISEEWRAHLQSHGLSGVQARHYDRHSYAPEKREAIETLRRIIEGAEMPNVTSLATARSRARRRAQVR
jgi:hypothetical protein